MSESRDASEAFDPVRLGENLQRIRLSMGLAQKEAARRAGIGVRTLYGIERGESVRLASIRKLCAGYEVSLQDAALREPPMPTPANPAVVHRGDSPNWYAPLDLRKAHPMGNASLVQDAAERRRLGRLGLVPVFSHYPFFVLPAGPGLTLLEVYGRYEGRFNADIYRSAVFYCLRGSVRLSVAGRTIELDAGDFVAFASADLEWTEPREASPVLEAPSLLWIGADRVVKAISGGRARVRARRPSGVAP